MTPADAQRQYPLAWCEIERQIAEVGRASGASVFVMGALLMVERDVPVLHVITMTDLDLDLDDGADLTAMGFRAPIAPPAAVQAPADPPPARVRRIGLLLAERRYSAAWNSIQRQLAAASHEYCSDIVPIAAYLISEPDGVEVLHVEALTDLVPLGADGDCSRMGFRAPVALNG